MSAFDYKRESVEKIKELTSEFAAPEERKIAVDEIPNEKEREIVARCWDLWNECIKGPNRVEPNATEHLQRYEGKWNLAQPGEYRLPQNRLNRAHIVVETNASAENDTELQISVKPKQDVGKELEAAVCELLLREIDIRPQTEISKHIACKYALIMGTRILQPHWEEDPVTKMGRVSIKTLDPRLVFANPDAVDRDSLRYVVILTQMNYAGIKRDFGEAAARRCTAAQSVTSPVGQPSKGNIFMLYAYYEDDTIEEQSVPIVPDTETHHGAIARAENDELLNAGTAPVIRKEQNHALHLREHEGAYAELERIHAMLEQVKAQGNAALAEMEEGPEREQAMAQRDAMLAEIEERTGLEQGTVTAEVLNVLRFHIEEHADLRDNPPREIRKVPKYPNGRCSVVTTTMVLYDSVNPYPEIPVIIVPNYLVPGSVFGMSEIRNTKGLHDNENRVLDKSCHVVQQFANVLLVPKGETEHIAAGAAFQELRTDRANEYRYIEIPSLSDNAKYLADRLQLLNQEATGQFDTMVGKRPRQVISGAAIEQLNIASLRRPDLKVKYLKQGYRELYSLALKIILERYRGVHILRVAGERGKALAEMLDKLRADNRYDENTTPVRYLATMRGDIRHFEVYAERLSGQYDIEIDIGVDTVHTNAERAELAVKLGQMGLLDQRAVLEAVKIPGREAILERTEQVKLLRAENEELKRALAEMQQQAAQAGMQPQGAGKARVAAGEQEGLEEAA